MARQSFGDNLRDEMTWAGVSCHSLARRACVSVGQVYRWRSGAHVPHADIIVRLADVLGCTCDDLMRGRL